jgi:hypothetical protein
MRVKFIISFVILNFILVIAIGSQGIFAQKTFNPCPPNQLPVINSSSGNYTYDVTGNIVCSSIGAPTP